MPLPLLQFRILGHQLACLLELQQPVPIFNQLPTPQKATNQNHAGLLNCNTNQGLGVHQHRPQWRGITYKG